jgi:hypothetical protein
MGSMVRSLDTKSLPAELIFFHTDLQGEQIAGSVNEEVKEGERLKSPTPAQAGSSDSVASREESAHLEKSYSPFCILP